MKKLLVISTLLLTMFNHTYAQKIVELKDAIHILEVLSGIKTNEQPDPYKLVFADEFDGDSLDTTIWNYETGYGTNGWGNDEWQLYTSSEENVIVENGTLTISARTSGNFGKRDGSITSGRINTMGKKSFRHGKILARIKTPYKQGVWAAFWMLGSNFSTDGWPKCGEIDIMETFAQYLPSNQNQGTLHWWNEDAGIKTDSIAYNAFSSPYPNIANCSSPLDNNFHIYEIEWDHNKIVWRIDGVDYYWEYISHPTKSEFQNEFFIIFNLAVGGHLGGYVDQNTFPLDTNNNPVPQNLYVDWVRVYQIIEKSSLEYAINSANSIKDSIDIENATGHISEADFATFVNTIAIAQDVFENEDATQNEIDQANETLTSAIDTFLAQLKRMDEEFLFITSGYLTVSDQTIISEWSTGTQIKPNVQYKGKECLELKSGTKPSEQGNWGTVLALVDGMIADFSDYSKMDLTIATTGGYIAYKVSITTGAGRQLEYVLPVDDTIKIWQDISVPIADFNSIQQIAIMGIGGERSISKIYISDFKLVSKKFVLISSIDAFFSDVEFSANTIGEWSTGTAINVNALYEGKKCWELTSRGSWGSVLAFQDGINGNFSNDSKLKVSMATTGGYSEYKVTIVPISGNNKEFVLPVDDAISSWQDISLEISGLNAINQIAIYGVGGEAGVSKVYVTDFYLTNFYLDLLPTDTQLNLYCENVGIHPENCVMDDEDNPYRFAGVNEENKWDLASGYPKVDFYLWATALANQGNGENQFYVAENLHKLYTLNGSEVIRKQTIKAYKSVLENFYDSKAAHWNSEGVFITEVFLRDKAGQRLYGFWGESNENHVNNMKAGGMFLKNLFETKSHAKSTMNDWGYIFDNENGVIIQKR